MRNNYLQEEMEEIKSTENDLSSAASGCFVMELYYGKCLACVCCGDCFESEFVAFFANLAKDF